jgi:hypothetical protein
VDIRNDMDVLIKVRIPYLLEIETSAGHVTELSAVSKRKKIREENNRCLIRVIDTT